MKYRLVYQLVVEINKSLFEKKVNELSEENYYPSGNLDIIIHGGEFYFILMMSKSEPITDNQ